MRSFEGDARAAGRGRLLREFLPPTERARAFRVGNAAWAIRQEEERASAPMPVWTCPQCGTRFLRRAGQVRTGAPLCSRRCAAARQSAGRCARQCPSCGNTFQIPVYRLRDGVENCCSVRCSARLRQAKKRAARAEEGPCPS